ncbi:hypothetical protein PR048_005013 [Dryococelus australis]|uniref:YqaJ viral recombinase domain-containing protein n=1 Tax=Dryococelus australis TaxID=614101 RepID=A0ABQ9I935_9NEOP|nr:hypothetical protein PR048_005013 [Dryococelus australis]
MVYLKEDDPRMKLLCADNIQDADMELSAGIGDIPRRNQRVTRYGIANKLFAIAQLQKQLEREIEPAGLFVNPVLPWLAATTDGLVGNDALVEVKCPVTTRNLTPQGAVKEKKLTYCVLKDDHIHLKENHPYRYQVQGQLRISQRKNCYFVLWTRKEYQ